jgi:hypothetical protein
MSGKCPENYGYVKGVKILDPRKASPTNRPGKPQKWSKRAKELSDEKSIFFLDTWEIFARNVPHTLFGPKKEKKKVFSNTIYIL